MNLVSVRIATDDVTRLVGFYETVTGTSATWLTPEFAEVGTAGAAVAISSREVAARFTAGALVPEGNSSLVVELLVDDVDAEWVRLRDVGEPVLEPTTLPWGNRSMLVRDPDGGLVNLFTPVSAEARAKYRALGVLAD